GRTDEGAKNAGLACHVLRKPGKAHLGLTRDVAECQLAPGPLGCEMESRLDDRVDFRRVVHASQSSGIGAVRQLASSRARRVAASTALTMRGASPSSPIRICNAACVVPL